MNTALVTPELPSTTVASEIESDGRPSSFRIVPWPWASIKKALTGLLRLTNSVSLASEVVSPLINTVMV